ncbi:putative Ig domain-containing protein [Actinoplanes sp. NPDC049316]|uniref:putative Ig domain-containing protein n=1 Tax=Actinoplanes sp. NPDC049316 TaxID=3154727 RepID=UPI00343EA0D0
MPTDRAAVAVPRTPRRRAAGDGGFSLVEVLVAMAIIGTVMGASVPFMTRTLAASNQQADQQVAIQLATDGLERVRALNPKSLLTGRGEQSVKEQWDTAPAVVKSRLATMRSASDPMLPAGSTDGRLAPLPTKAVETVVNGTTYNTQWYVGKCWQGVAAGSPPVVGACTAPADATVTPAGPAFYRVVVATTWTSRACTTVDHVCAYLASTMTSIGIDPVFNTKLPPPTINGLAAQVSYVGDTVSLPVTSGGTPPLTWSATGLPAGLTIAAATGLISGTPTTAGTSSVTVTVIDRDKRTDDSSFTWKVFQAPALTNPGNRTSRTGTAVSLQPVLTGGQAPLTWSITGLPAGLTYSTSTGLITGTPTTVQALTTTITVTDAGKRAVTATFSWRVLTPVQLYNPGPQSMTNNTNVGTFTPYAWGGLGPYTWQAQNLPDGLTMDPKTGEVSGVVRHGTRYVVTVTVTDDAGGTATMTVVCTVTPSSGGDLTITSPTNPDRSTAVNTSVSFTAGSTGSNPNSHTWTATGLPPGVTIARTSTGPGNTTTATVSGKPTVKGTYHVTLIVTSGTSWAKQMFTWTVT